MKNEFPSSKVVSDAMIELFCSAVSKSRENLIEALVPVDRNMERGFALLTKAPDWEMQETCNLLNDFKKAIDIFSDQETQIRFKILTYIHIMEADLPCAIVWNLLNLINNIPISWAFSRVQKGKEEICEYPSQKISEIQILSEKANLSIGEILFRIWNGELRNSFSHSAYMITKDYYCPTGDLSPVSRRNRKKALKSLSFSDIEKYYLASVTYFLTFLETYKCAIFPFKCGDDFPLGKGLVHWDKVRGWDWKRNKAI